ncbi:hypothetical protein P7C70_g7635, partial [Phenoliferia sp. Uapishka_3]
MSPRPMTHDDLQLLLLLFLHLSFFRLPLLSLSAQLPQQRELGSQHKLKDAVHPQDLSFPPSAARTHERKDGAWATVGGERVGEYEVGVDWMCRRGEEEKVGRVLKLPTIISPTLWTGAPSFYPWWLMFALLFLRAALPRFLAPKPPRPGRAPAGANFTRSAASTSSALLTVTPKGARTRRPSLPPPLSVLGLTPTQFVASQTLNAQALRDYAAWQGFESELRAGPFTLSECKAVQAAAESAASALGKALQDVVHITSAAGRIRALPFWTLVASSVPMRSQMVVRIHVRAKNPLTRVKGQWSKVEDARLISFVDMNGSGSWSPLAEELHRTRLSCTGRWLHLRGAAKSTKSGPWGEEESARLSLALNELDTGIDGRRPPTFWASIASRVETRSPQQCIRKYRAATSPQLDVAVSQFGCLVEAVESQQVEKESSIDWEGVKIPLRSSKKWVGLPTPRTLYNTWSRLLEEPRKFDILDHAGQVKWLRERWVLRAVRGPDKQKRKSRSLKVPEVIQSEV